LEVRALLDTNRLSDFFRGDEDLSKTLERAVEVWIPFGALAEVKAGFLSGRKRTENEAALHAFLQQPGVGTLYADHETADVYAQLFAQLRRAGTPIPANDIWIASLSVQHHLTLLTRDRHFDKVPQVLRA
jgi:tRNA(fMet)-specific endonuclease VapC